MADGSMTPKSRYDQVLLNTLSSLPELDIPLRDTLSKQELSLEEKQLYVLDRMGRQKTDIEQLIEKLDEAKICLRDGFRLQNLVPHCHILPDEVLEHVYLLCCDGGLSQDSEAYRQPLVLSHVCQRWRNITLSMGDVWAYIPLDNLKLAALFLPRTKMATLHIDMTNLQDPSPPAAYLEQVKFVPRYVSRLGTVRMSTQALLFRAVASAIQEVRLPKLRSLSIRSTDTVYNNISIEEHRLFFSVAAPSLRIFELEVMDMPWKSTLLAGGQLRRLSISKQFSPELSAILDILRANPLLETLELERFRNDPGVSQAGSDRILLPNLRRMAFNLIDFSVEALLERLNTPAEIYFRHSFFITAFHLEGLQPSGLEQIISKPRTRLGHLRAFQGEHVETVTYGQTHVYGGYDIAASVTYHGPAVPSPPHTSPPHPQLEIVLASVSSRNPQYHIFESLGQSLALPNLRTLQLSGIFYRPQPDNPRAVVDPQGVYSQATWNAVFSWLPSLTHLVLLDCEIVEPLKCLIDDDSSRDTAELRCPGLRTLHIRFPIEYPLAGARLELDQLPTWLSTRRIGATSLESLQLSPFQVEEVDSAPAWKTAMRTLIGSVVIDGVQGSETKDAAGTDAWTWTFQESA